LNDFFKAASDQFLARSKIMARKKRAKPIEESAAGAASVRAAEENASSNILSSAISIQEKIALLAYTYWEKRGRTGGSPEEDWFRAEREILTLTSAESR
jgi:hypothetical protein